MCAVRPPAVLPCAVMLAVLPNTGLAPAAEVSDETLLTRVVRVGLGEAKLLRVANALLALEILFEDAWELCPMELNTRCSSGCSMLPSPLANTACMLVGRRGRPRVADSSAWYALWAPEEGAWCPAGVAADVLLLPVGCGIVPGLPACRCNSK